MRRIAWIACTLLASCRDEIASTKDETTPIETVEPPAVTPAEPRPEPPPQLDPEPDTPCPAGMALVPGGRWTEPQLERFARWNREVEPEAQLVFAESVEPFCLDLEEFTWDRYAACIRSERCPPAHAFRGWIAYHLPENPRPLDEAERARLEAGTADKATQARQFIGRPVTNIASLEALEVCEALGGSLPTIEQWLWAYRGGEEDRPSPWGDAPADVTRANLCDAGCLRRGFTAGDDEDCESRACRATSKMPDDGFIETAPVGSFPQGAGRWGHLDLEGNVDEMVTVRVSPLAEKRRQPEAGARTRAGVFRSWCGSVFHDSAIERGEESRRPWFPCSEVGGRPVSNQASGGAGAFGPSRGFRCAHQSLGGSNET